MKDATGGKDSAALRELRTCLELMGKMVKTTPQRREQDLELAIAQKISEATMGFNPSEIARLKALVEGNSLPVPMEAANGNGRSCQ